MRRAVVLQLLVVAMIGGASPNSVGEEINLIEKSVKAFEPAKDAISFLDDLVEGTKQVKDTFDIIRKGGDPPKLDAKMYHGKILQDRYTDVLKKMQSFKVPSDMGAGGPTMPTPDALSSRDFAVRRTAVSVAVSIVRYRLHTTATLREHQMALQKVRADAEISLKAIGKYAEGIGPFIKEGVAGVFDPLTNALGWVYYDMEFTFPERVAKIRDEAARLDKEIEDAVAKDAESYRNLVVNVNNFVKAEDEALGASLKELNAYKDALTQHLTLSTNDSETVAQANRLSQQHSANVKAFNESDRFKKMQADATAYQQLKSDIAQSLKAIENLDAVHPGRNSNNSALKADYISRRNSSVDSHNRAVKKKEALWSQLEPELKWSTDTKAKLETELANWKSLEQRHVSLAQRLKESKTALNARWSNIQKEFPTTAKVWEEHQFDAEIMKVAEEEFVLKK